MNTHAAQTLDSHRPSTDPVTPAEPWTPFNRVARNALTGMIERDALLAQPPETFRPFFGGRTPSLLEKIQFVEGAIQRMTSLNIYENNLYHVEITYSQPFIHLNVRRRDGQPCKDWRHFQAIKNELIGPEFEAVELFPAESRLVDTSNEYHLWVSSTREFRFPFGFPSRWTLEKEITARIGPTCTDRGARPLHADSASALHVRPASPETNDFGN